MYDVSVVFNLIFLCILSTWGACLAAELDFPPGFRFGAATAAYQVEGGWNASDKSPSIWDTYTHQRPDLIADHSNGDEACDSYHLWQKDVEIAKELDLHFYRLSISWPRLLPNGFANKISEDGKNYYSNLINALLENGIEPVVTLYHWDLPQRLQDLGGWANPLISDWFADYARVAYTLYGDRVKTWLTINEPISICSLGYGADLLAPLGLGDPYYAVYLCDKHVMMAHGKAYRIYDEEFRSRYHGRVSLANQLMWVEPFSEEYNDLTELVTDYLLRRHCHPIFSKEGGWPPLMVQEIAERSKREGWPRSRLLDFTPEEKALVQGTYDFLGLNHYTSRVARDRRPGDSIQPLPFGAGLDLDISLLTNEDWAPGSSSWFKVYPEGIRKLLRWVKKEYGDVEIMITENGYSSDGYERNDEHRMNYYIEYLKQVLLSIKVDGVNVSAYTAWTLIDNYEWLDGYRVKFGLYEVDFESPNRTRTPRRSANYYRRVIAAHSLDVPIPDDKDEFKKGTK